jgi:hypothetical protein
VPPIGSRGFDLTGRLESAHFANDFFFRFFEFMMNFFIN